MNKFVVAAAFVLVSLGSAPAFAEDGVSGSSSTHYSMLAEDTADSGNCVYRDRYGQRYEARCRGCEASAKSIPAIENCLRHLAFRLNDLRSQVSSLDWSTNDTMLVELAVYKADLAKLQDDMKRSSLIPSKHLVAAGDALMGRFQKIEADFAVASKTLEEQPAAEKDPLADCKPNCG